MVMLHASFIMCAFSNGLLTVCKIASLGRNYLPYAKRVEDDGVSGQTIEFVFEQNFNAGKRMPSPSNCAPPITNDACDWAGLEKLLLDLDVQRWTHRTVLKVHLRLLA
jgi:hypothetical protein